MNLLVGFAALFLQQVQVTHFEATPDLECYRRPGFSIAYVQVHNPTARPLPVDVECVVHDAEDRRTLERVLGTLTAKASSLGPGETRELGMIASKESSFPSWDELPVRCRARNGPVRFDWARFAQSVWTWRTSEFSLEAYGCDTFMVPLANHRLCFEVHLPTSRTSSRTVDCQLDGGDSGRKVASSTTTSVVFQYFRGLPEGHHRLKCVVSDSEEKLDATVAVHNYAGWWEVGQFHWTSDGVELSANRRAVHRRGRNDRSFYTLGVVFQNPWGFNLRAAEVECEAPGVLLTGRWESWLGGPGPHAVEVRSNGPLPVGRHRLTCTLNFTRPSFFGTSREVYVTVPPP